MHNHNKMNLQGSGGIVTDVINALQCIVRGVLLLFRIVHPRMHGTIRIATESLVPLVIGHSPIQFGSLVPRPNILASHQDAT